MPSKFSKPFRAFPPRKRAPKEVLQNSQDKQKAPRPSIRLAQNFLKNQGLVASLVAGADLAKDDLVCEIGPGWGIITRELAGRVAKVIAIELEETLFEQLKTELKDYRDIELVHGDFLKFPLPDQEYKIFSNIPFNLTADILRKLLHDKNPPVKSYLIVQREAAEKYSGEPSETQSSILLKPWYAFSIVHNFQPADFDPVPSVDTVLFLIEKREHPLVTQEQAALYRAFVKHGFSQWRSNLGKNFKDVFTYMQWKRLAKDLSFNLHAQPTDLKFDQWLGLFKFFFSAMQKGQAMLPQQPSGNSKSQARPSRLQGEGGRGKNH